jgi:hypothetical protein
MRALFLTVLGGIASSTLAQSPLTTTFSSNANNGLSPGGTVYFDLTVSRSASIQQIDVNVREAVNTPGSIRVYTVPTTWVGKNTTASLWTQVATATMTSAGPGNPTVCAINPPIILPIGSYGIAIEHLGCGPLYTVPATNQTFMTNEMSLTAGGAFFVAFGPGTLQPRVWNGSIHYTLPGGIASARSFGQGCYNNPVSFYELFGPVTFDLVGKSIRLLPNGQGGYVLIPGLGGWHTPTGANLNIPYLNVSAPRTLPFTIEGPRFRTSSVVIGSGGRIWFGTPYTVNFAPTPTDLLSFGPNLCVCWTDINPQAGGTITGEVTTAGTYVVSWNNVPQYQQPQNTNTFQAEIYPNGHLELRWQSIGTLLPIMVGFSQGGRARDPGSIDLSVLPYHTGVGRLPLQLEAMSRPLLGTNMSLTTSNVPLTSQLGLSLLGIAQFDPGLDLGPVGMPGCNLHVGLDFNVVHVPANGLMNLALAIPNVPALSGGRVQVQSMVLAGGFNALGAISSNGIELQLGTR